MELMLSAPSLERGMSWNGHWALSWDGGGVTLTRAGRQTFFDALTDRAAELPAKLMARFVPAAPQSASDAKPGPLQWGRTVECELRRIEQNTGDQGEIQYVQTP